MRAYNHTLVFFGILDFGAIRQAHSGPPWNIECYHDHRQVYSKVLKTEDSKKNVRFEIYKISQTI